MAAPVTRPRLRAGFFLPFAAFLTWIAFDGSDRGFLRWPTLALALLALGFAGHFARIALRQRGSRA